MKSTDAKNDASPSGVRFPDTLVFNGYAAPVRIEGDAFDLEVTGTIPAELSGCYIRNSADHQFPPMNENDLFLNGDGMLHQVSIHAGHADLRTRYVQTEKFKLEREARRALFGAYRNMYTDDPSVIGRERTTANTSIVWHAGRLLALKEASRPVEIEPQTLATIGNYDFAGQLSSAAFTAHPKLDPRTGEMVAFGYFTKTTADKVIEIYYIDREGRLTRTESIEAPYPSMVHDCMLSEHYVIFTICPMICDWARVQQGKPFFHWDDRKPTLVAVVPRGVGGASRVRWFQAPKTVMQTHSFNAWEEGELLHLEHFVTDTGWLSQFPDINNPAAVEKPPYAYRWTLNMKSTSSWFDSTRIFPHVGEMPMIDLRFLTSKTRHFWFGTTNTTLGPMLPRGPKGPPFTCLGHFDAVTEKLECWYAGANSSPEEPVFVPQHPSSPQGHGWLMAIVGRRAENRTDLVILDALNLPAGPVATIKFPCRVHEGFHGVWMPSPASAGGHDERTS